MPSPTHPNFLIAGGVATGTSFLSSTLAGHPEIYLPQIHRPEPNFFCYSWRYKAGIRHYESQWFSDVGVERAIGERSSLLLTCKEAPARIHSHYPNIRIIFCLRNPIERAWANYRFTVLEGLEDLEFCEALAMETTRSKTLRSSWAEVKPHAYLERSRYSEGITRYMRLFPPEQILFLKSETMSSNSAATLRQVCRFLNVSDKHVLESAPDFAAPSVRNRHEQVRLRELLGESLPALVEAIRQKKAFPQLAEEMIPLADRLRKNLYAEKHQLNHEDRDTLQSALRDEIDEVAKLTGLDTSDWR